jgi:hypothetical protein
MQCSAHATLRALFFLFPPHAACAHMHIFWAKNTPARLDFWPKTTQTKVASCPPQPKSWKFPRGMQLGFTIVRVRVARVCAYATQGQLHECSLVTHLSSILSLVLPYAELGGELAGEATRAGGNMRTTRAHYLAGLIGGISNMQKMEGALKTNIKHGT